MLSPDQFGFVGDMPYDDRELRYHSSIRCDYHSLHCVFSRRKSRRYIEAEQTAENEYRLRKFHALVESICGTKEALDLWGLTKRAYPNRRRWGRPIARRRSWTRRALDFLRSR